MSNNKYDGHVYRIFNIILKIMVSINNYITISRKDSGQAGMTRLQPIHDKRGQALDIRFTGINNCTFT